MYFSKLKREGQLNRYLVLNLSKPGKISRRVTWINWMIGMEVKWIIRLVKDRNNNTKRTLSWQRRGWTNEVGWHSDYNKGLWWLPLISRKKNAHPFQRRRWTNCRFFVLLYLVTQPIFFLHIHFFPILPKGNILFSPI